MFKTALTAAAFALIAGLAHAAPVPLTATPITQDIVQYEELAYYCEWAYVYDVWGNWVTAWQCY